MAKSLRLILLLFLIITPLIFYKSLTRKDSPLTKNSLFSTEEVTYHKPKIALIFDDLGESLQDLKDIYSLDIPLTISIIPNLKFSKNIAHIGARCGFAVFIHLPLEPEEANQYRSDKYKFINSKLSKREIMFLLRNYFNSIRMAIGVNNHMGSQATQDSGLMNIILEEIKKRNLIFIDSRTSTKSVAYELANDKGLICGYNEGFLDSLDDSKAIEKKMEELIATAKTKDKIIIIAHPRKNTLNFLKSNLNRLRETVEFITIKDYFNL